MAIEDWIDGGDEDHDDRPRADQICKACGKGDLMWGQHWGGDWILIEQETDRPHVCPARRTTFNWEKQS